MFVVLLKSMLFPCNMEEPEMTHQEIMNFYHDPNHHKDFKIWLSRLTPNAKQFIDRHLHDYVQTWAVHLKQNKLIRDSESRFKNIELQMKHTRDALEDMLQEHEVNIRKHNLNLAHNQAMKKALQHAINAFRRQSHSEQQQRKPVPPTHSNPSDNHSNRYNHKSNRSEIQTLIYEGRPPPGDAARYIQNSNGYTIIPSSTYTINNIDYVWGGDPHRPHWMYRVKGQPYWEKYDKIKVQKLEYMMDANGVRSKRDSNGDWYSTVMATPYHVPLDLTA